MKRRATLWLMALLMFPFSAMFGSKPAEAASAISSWQRSAAYSPAYATEYSSPAFQDALRQLVSDGGNYVTLVVPYHQSSIYSTDVQAGNDTPTTASLIDGIQYAHSLGLSVMLKPHVDPYDGQWRANINPSDRATWFGKYGDILTSLAKVGAANSVEQLCLGTELWGMASNVSNPTNATYWQSMINNVKAVYPGKLTYSAQYMGNRSEKNEVSFWPQLDYLGLSAYYGLGNSSYASVADLKSAWDGWNTNDIKPFQQRYNKPLLFTEVGYRSVSGAHIEPWNYGRTGAVDQDEQARDYEALLSYWSAQPNFAGVSLWDWNSTGDTSYSVRGKKAEQTLKQFFTALVPTPGTGGSYSSNVSTNPATVATGSPSTVTLSITSPNTSSDVIADLEIYDAGGLKVFQAPFEHQNLSAGVASTWSASWTPVATGVYSVKAGIFASGWTSNLYWNNNAATISVGTQTTPSPTPTPTPTPNPTPSPTPAPQAAQLSIWWPGAGVTVSGVQPFKALLDGRVLSDYTIAWQVDGGQSNLLANSLNGTPHKESAVDVSSWNWNTANTYKITFTAKDLNGNILATRDVSITVSH